MKKFILILLLFPLISFTAEENKVQTLDDLMRLVQIEKAQQTEEFKIREAQFLREKQKQQSLLNTAEKELQELEKIQEDLLSEFKQNEKELAELNNELQVVVGVLGDLFGVVKQLAADLLGEVSSSIVSAEITNRENFLGLIVDRPQLPNIKELRRLWLELQLEASELGQVRKFEAQVVTESGSLEKLPVVRIGGFNLVSQGEFLSYQEKTSQNCSAFKTACKKILKLY